MAMKAIFFAVASILMLQQPNGCEQAKQPVAPDKPHQVAYQRFVPVPAEQFARQGVPWHGYFALDTRTGTLCRTIPFERLGGPAEWANNVPDCQAVLRASPD
jgi:hypothetical protein